MIKNFEFIPEYAQNYLFYCKNIKNMSEKTVNEYYLDLRIFFRFIKSYKILEKELPFNEIDASDIGLDLLQKLNLSDIYVYINYTHDERLDNIPTRSRKISSLKSFFKYLCKQGLLNENPTLYLDAPKMKNSLPVYLSIEESLALLESIDGNNKERNYAIITLFLNCGLRLSELVGINLNNINDNYLRVIGKGNKERSIYLNDSCKTAINNYLKVRPNDGIVYKDKNALFISRNKKKFRTGWFKI
jgi:site-specific recombinase XerD